MAEFTYKYIWTDHTLVKISKDWPKVRVEAWEIFESNIEIKNTYIKQIKSDFVSEKTTVDWETGIDRKELVKKYIEVFGKKPWPKRTDEEILSKIS